MNLQEFKNKLQGGSLLTEGEVEKLANKTIELLALQPNVVQADGPRYLVGDVHGQFYDFLKIVKQVSKCTINIPIDSKCVFLGDYVDRGYHSTETICYLLVLKCIDPTGYVLIRGNHETSSLTRTYGFYDEVQRKYGNNNVWNKIIEVFTYLPLACVISNTVLCIHGGLSPSLPLVQDFAQIERCRDIPESGAMSDIVWSDPQPGESEGWSVNSRGAGYLFSKHVTRQFLDMNGLKTIVRAHQLVEEGHVFNFTDERLVTLWSAPNYCYRCGNQASVMRVASGEEYSFTQFGPAAKTSVTKIHFDNVLPYFL